MGQFWQRLTSATKTIGRMVFVECAGDIGVIIGAVLAAFLATNIAGAIVSTADLDPVVRIRIAYVVPIVTMSVVFLATSLFHLKMVTRHERLRRSLVYAVAIGIALLLVKVALQGTNEMRYDFSASSILFVFSTCLVAPFCEELFFRGYVWSKLRARNYDDRLIVVCTTLLYMMPHLPGSAAAFLEYATIGVCLGLICYFSGGILLSFVFHALMNLIVVFGVN
ncbi:CPBP family intramembrane glutamic endopeptidase [Rhizobium sp.]|uniref:CPBP family intramembrane glutamic endopeptidase n=1 Tax=Rhizobium sp. TaxID=391 RepID=UPI0028B0C232